MKEFGVVREDLWKRIEEWDPSVRRELEEDMLAKDRMMGHIIKTYVLTPTQSPLLVLADTSLSSNQTRQGNLL